jgi:hypothetical protein
VRAGKSSSTRTSHFSMWKSDYIFLQFVESSRHPVKHCYILKFSNINKEFHDWGSIGFQGLSLEEHFHDWGSIGFQGLSLEEHFRDWGSIGFQGLSLKEHSLWCLPHCSFYTRVNRRSSEQWGYQLCFKG